jgi:hypothetical protein
MFLAFPGSEVVSTKIKVSSSMDPNLLVYYLTPETIKTLEQMDKKQQKLGIKLDFSVIKFFLWTPGWFLYTVFGNPGVKEHYKEGLRQISSLDTWLVSSVDTQ